MVAGQAFGPQPPGQDGANAVNQSAIMDTRNTTDIRSKVGKYTLLGEIGRGATSRVYRGKDPFAGREVAIKIVRPEPGVDETARRRLRKAFLTEASMVGKLNHPHIIEIYDADLLDDFGYIVMELIEGTTLMTHCEQASLLPLEQIVEVAFKCSRALEFAHRHGVIHRDVKPANILITKDGEVKISDFGTAMNEETEHTQLEGVGTPLYMSPEQVENKELTPQSDVYSLGSAVYHLLTGRPTFSAGSRASLAHQIVHIEPSPPSAYRTGIPAELDRVVMRALNKNVRERYRSAADLSRDLWKSHGSLLLPVEASSDSEQFNAIKDLPFFRDFSEVEIWETVRLSMRHVAQPEAAVAREGEIGRSFFLITSGKARVSKQGREVDTLTTGDCFGEILYFEKEIVKRSTSISAAADLTYIAIALSALQKASDACQKQFNRAFMRILVARLAGANDRAAQRSNRCTESEYRFPG